jgi:hypothetical protein
VRIRDEEREYYNTKQLKRKGNANKKKQKLAKREASSILPDNSHTSYILSQASKPFGGPAGVIAGSPNASAGILFCVSVKAPVQFQPRTHISSHYSSRSKYED